jgi:diguanylate cyclase (GGDEF)-like protein
MSWQEFPDLLAVGLLIYAFVAVARPSGTVMTRLWLAGWICVEFHFAAFSFLDVAGVGGMVAAALGMAALTWAAFLFCWSMDPVPERISSRALFWASAAIYTLYLSLSTWADAPRPLMEAAALLFALVPLALVCTTPRAQRPATRWLLVLLNIALSAGLMRYQFSAHGPDLMDALPLSVAYLCCCVQFWFARQSHTGGFFVTIVGLLAWAAVFPVGMATDLLIPSVHIDAEVWNLPKYLVAVGMIMLLLEHQLKQNQHLAHHDALTGLPNRRLFEDRLNTAVTRARRDGVTAAMLAIDLDGFKRINDTLGHRAGDEALQLVTQRFASCVRRVDTLARTGGDEFSVVLEGPITRDAAHRIAQTLKQSLEAPLTVAERTMQLGASVGLALFPDDAATEDTLCVLADQRMYAAKRSSEPQGM